MGLSIRTIKVITQNHIRFTEVNYIFIMECKKGDGLFEWLCYERERLIKKVKEENEVMEILCCMNKEIEDRHTGEWKYLANESNNCELVILENCICCIY